MVAQGVSSKELGAMEDLRDTAYTYHKVAKDDKANDNDAAVNDLFNQMDQNRDERISFKEFKSYMKTMDCAKYGSNEKLFKRLAGEKDYLDYSDVVTLLYIVNSGRPICERCNTFVEGLFFTCVQCFEKEKEYYFNFCPSCYCAGKNQGHCHKEFVDPVVLLLLKAKRESKQPPVSNPKTTYQQPSNSKTNLSSSASVSKKKDESIRASNNSTAIVVHNPQQPSRSDSKTSLSSSTSFSRISRPSESNAIIVVRDPHQPIRRPGRALELMQFAVGGATIVGAVAQFCTIM